MFPCHAGPLESLRLHRRGANLCPCPARDGKPPEPKGHPGAKQGTCAVTRSRATEPVKQSRPFCKNPSMCSLSPPCLAALGSRGPRRADGSILLLWRLQSSQRLLPLRPQGSSLCKPTDQKSRGPRESQGSFQMPSPAEVGTDTGLAFGAHVFHSSPGMSKSSLLAPASWQTG